MNLEPPVVWRHNQARKRYLGEVGTVVSFSVVTQGPTYLQRRTPYIVALIQIGKEAVVAQIVDVSNKGVSKGMKVVGVLRRLFDVDKRALHIYGVKFAPLRK